MMNRINAIIDLNLQLLYNAKKKPLNLNEFKDDLGKQFQDPKTFARLLQIKKLVIGIPKDKNCFQLTEFGKEICEKGGWLEYLKKQNKVVQKKEVEEKTEIKKSKKRWLTFFSLIVFLIFIADKGILLRL